MPTSTLAFEIIALWCFNALGVLIPLIILAVRAKRRARAPILRRPLRPPLEYL